MRSSSVNGRAMMPPAARGRTGYAGIARSLPAVSAALAVDQLAVDWLAVLGCRADSPVWLKVAGTDSTLNLVGGQITRKARPITLFSGMVPSRSQGSQLAPEIWQSCALESAESSRLSPMTHSRPGGTTTLNLTVDGALPGYR